MGKPKSIFIASSTQSKPIAKSLATKLKTNLNPSADPADWGFDINLWGPETLPPSEDILDSLITNAKNSDFLVVLLMEDDVAQKKDQTLSVPRDNAIFELGLFIGALGLEPRRCFMVSSVVMGALPSDLLGRMLITIKQPPPPIVNTVDYGKYVDAASETICKRLNEIQPYTRPELSLITKGELAERERSSDEVGGNLAIESDVVAVVVNSVQPVEQLDRKFCATVIKNIMAGARYEYFFGELKKNKVATANLLQSLALGELKPAGMPPERLPAFMKEKWDNIWWNLECMKRRLGIHFRKRPPLQFCVHNAQREGMAISYLRCSDAHRDKFVEWADGRAAVEIAEELTSSCAARDPDCCIFHSTIDFPLHEAEVNCDPDVLGVLMKEEFSLIDKENATEFLTELREKRHELVEEIRKSRSELLIEVKKKFPNDLPADQQKALDDIWLGKQ